MNQAEWTWPRSVLGLEQVQGLGLRQAARALGVVLEHEARGAAPDHQADLRGLAGVLLRLATRTVEGDDLERRLQDQRPGRGVGDDLFQVAAGDGAVDGDQGARVVVAEDLAVVAVRQRLLAGRAEEGDDAPAQQADVLLRPAGVDVGVQELERTLHHWISSFATAGRLVTPRLLPPSARKLNSCGRRLCDRHRAALRWCPLS